MSKQALITDTSVLRRRGDVEARNVDEALLMTNAATGELFGLESIALRVWQLLERPRTLADLCSQLQTEYLVDQATCRSDVLDFVGELLDEGLVVLAE